jgi:hypothetical protein
MQPPAFIVHLEFDGQFAALAAAAVVAKFEYPKLIASVSMRQCRNPPASIIRVQARNWRQYIKQCE